MSEKEFLKTFYQIFIESGLDEEYIDRKIDSFLEYHHKEYYEVEFIRKPENEIPSVTSGRIQSVTENYANTPKEK